jgi:hypothetical protein
MHECSLSRTQQKISLLYKTTALHIIATMPSASEIRQKLKAERQERQRREQEEKDREDTMLQELAAAEEAERVAEEKRRLEEERRRVKEEEM